MGNSFLPFKKACLFVLAVLMVPVIAQDDADLDFASMSLEDLLNVEVVTASKQAESINDAPAVVSTISAREIRQFGGTHLIDVLERLPAMQAVRPQLLWPTLTFRGGDIASNGLNHWLMLLNGRPFSRGSYNGGGQWDPLYTLPIDIVQRIEIIRGPGSVLYGTNAFEGVINIITKTDEESKLDIRGYAGSFGGTDINVTGNYVSGDFRLTASLKSFQEDGPDYNGNDTFTTAPWQFEDEEDNFGLMVDMAYKGFSFTASISEMEFINRAFTDVSDDNEQEFFNLGYEHTFNDNWSWENNLTFNNNDFSFTNLGNGVLDWTRRNEDVLFESTVFGRLSEKVKFLFGGLYEQIEGGSFNSQISSGVEIRDYDETNWSLYTQFDFQVTEKVKIIAGGQLNNSGVVDDSKFVPRIGTVINFNEDFGMKLLYGEAFRAPSVAEVFVDQAAIGLTGPNPGLQFETVTTIDLQIFANTNNFQFTGTIFQSEQEDIIKVDSNPDPNYLQWFNNVGTVEATGVELEFKYVPNENLYLIGSYTYQQNEETILNIDDFTLGPEYTGKIGIGYDNKWVSLGVFNSLYDSYKPLTTRGTTPVVVQPESDSYNWLTAKASFHFTNLGRAKLHIDLYGENLLDEEVYVPEAVVLVLNTLPDTQGSAFYGGVRVEF